MERSLLNVSMRGVNQRHPESKEKHKALISEPKYHYWCKGANQPFQASVQRHVPLEPRPLFTAQNVSPLLRKRQYTVLAYGAQALWMT